MAIAFLLCCMGSTTRNHVSCTTSTNSAYSRLLAVCSWESSKIYFGNVSWASCVSLSETQMISFSFPLLHAVVGNLLVCGVPVGC